MDYLGDSFSFAGDYKDRPLRENVILTLVGLRESTVLNYWKNVEAQRKKADLNEQYGDPAHTVISQFEMPQ